jgi:hypothetical protein
MRRTTRSASQAAAALRMVAMTLGRGSTAPGAYYRRIAARKGKPRASTRRRANSRCSCTASPTATSCIADPDAYQAQQREHRFRQLRDRAATLGCDLIRRDTGEIVMAPRSSDVHHEVQFSESWALTNVSAPLSEEGPSRS